MIRKRRNQKEIPNPKTEVGKTKLTIRYLVYLMMYTFRNLKGLLESADFNARNGRNDFSFQFKKIITRYRRIGYNLLCDSLHA